VPCRRQDDDEDWDDRDEDRDEDDDEMEEVLVEVGICTMGFSGPKGRSLEVIVQQPGRVQHHIKWEPIVVFYMEVVT